MTPLDRIFPPDECIENAEKLDRVLDYIAPSKIARRPTPRPEDAEDNA